MSAQPTSEQERTRRRPPRVALIATDDPASPDTWSGVAAGILGGLRELGVEAVPVSLRLPVGLEQAMLVAGAVRTRNRFDAEGAAPTMSVRARIARRRLRGQRPDGVIQLGTTFKLPGGVPYVTLEDMTLRQGTSIHPVFSRMSPRGIAGWERRRAGIYRDARACAVASVWARESLRVDYGLPAERIATVGFGTNHRVPQTTRDWSTPRFLFVGIDWERKGGPQLLRAFARLREVHPDATLDVVGGHPPIEQPGVRGHGVLSQSRAGERDRVLELFARATCLAVPSSIEPFGIVYVEAGNAGIPSIAGAQGGARDAVGDGGVVLVEPNDEDGLLAAMLHLADPEHARATGAAAREHSALYTWPKVAERLLRALGLERPDGAELAGYIR
jgi:glycogen synthase